MLALGELVDEVYKHGRQADYVSMISDLIRKPKTLAKRFGREEERLALDVGFYSVLSRDKPGPHERAVWRELRSAKGLPLVQALHDLVINAGPDDLGPWIKVRFEASRV